MSMFKSDVWYIYIYASLKMYIQADIHFNGIIITSKLDIGIGTESKIWSLCRY